jgi:hypothetical protein
VLQQQRWYCWCWGSGWSVTHGGVASSSGSCVLVQGYSSIAVQLCLVQVALRQAPPVTECYHHTGRGFVDGYRDECQQIQHKPVTGQYGQRCLFGVLGPQLATGKDARSLWHLRMVHVLCWGQAQLEQIVRSTTSQCLTKAAGAYQPAQTSEAHNG